MTKPIPYVYQIKFLPTGQVYIGSRTAKNCNPKEFWMTYFTSQNCKGGVKDLIALNGKSEEFWLVEKIIAIAEYRDIKDIVWLENKMISDYAKEHGKDSLLNRKWFDDGLAVYSNAGNTLSEQTRKQISDKKKGVKESKEVADKKRKPRTLESREKQSLSAKGRIVTEETRIKISEKHKGKTLSQEYKEKISKAKTGTKHSLETKEKMSLVRKEKGKQPLASCIFCKVCGGVEAMKRYHFEKCKHAI